MHRTGQRPTTCRGRYQGTCSSSLWRREIGPRERRRYASGCGAWASWAVKRRGRVPPDTQGQPWGLGRGVPRLRRGWHSSPHPSLSPEGQRRLLKPHSHPVATEPHRPASYWSLDVPISQVSFELEIPSFPLHSAPCVRPSLSLVP